MDAQPDQASLPEDTLAHQVRAPWAAFIARHPLAFEAVDFRDGSGQAVVLNQDLPPVRSCFVFGVVPFGSNQASIVAQFRVCDIQLSQVPRSADTAALVHVLKIIDVVLLRANFLFRCVFVSMCFQVFLLKSSLRLLLEGLEKLR